MHPHPQSSFQVSLTYPQLIWATLCTTLVVYRKSSDMGGEAHTPDCSPRQRQRFHRSERLPHETQIHSPASHQSCADHHDPEEAPIQVRLVFSRFRDRPKRPTKVGCMGKQQVRPPRMEARYSTRRRKDRSHQRLATGDETDQRAVRVLRFQLRESLHTSRSWLRKWDRPSSYRHLRTCPNRSPFTKRIH